MDRYYDRDEYERLYPEVKTARLILEASGLNGDGVSAVQADAIIRNARFEERLIELARTAGPNVSDLSRQLCDALGLDPVTHPHQGDGLFRV